MSDETNKETQQEAKKSNSLVLILGAALVLVLGGGGGWFYLHQDKTAQASAPQPEQLHTVHLEGFTVNLADTEENHFLRITIDLGLGHAPKAPKEGESEIPTARVRDAILTVLTAGKADVLITTDGKAQLKKDVLAAVQKSAPDLDVREVYFTEFLVQR
ncbi:MAG: flagellar basal body-associated FliL family protein [Candidatus Acidiferrales bacterium]|jgi:flagellar FliL protein